MSTQGADHSNFSKQVGARETLKLRARKNKEHVLWFGFGMFGLIGWSVVVPTLLGVILGIWIDKQYKGGHSWTLTLLIVGLFIGVLNAWYWMQKEGKEIDKDQENG